MVTGSIIKKKIGDTKIYIDKLHLFPTYYKNEPFYDRALPRICQYIKDKDGYFKLIDVGANIGDSIALINSQVSGDFLAVEGEKNFLKLLEKNIKLFKNSYVEIEKSFCGINQNQHYTIKSQSGTASLTTEEGESKKTKIISLKSLDNILKEHPKFKDANILKIDTDGFEINILKSSINYLKRAKPILYFEYTPQFYKDHKQNFLDIFNLLISLGYQNSLFYDNYGFPQGIVKNNNTDIIKYYNSQIDNRFIHYYDILTFHKSKAQYNNLYETELLNHSQKSKLITDIYKKRLLTVKEKINNQKIEYRKTIDQKETEYKKSLFTYRKTIDQKETEYKKSLFTYRKTIDQKEAELNELKNQINIYSIENQILTQSLQKIYNSHAWRLLRHYYIIRDKFPIIKTPLKIFKLLLKIAKYLFRSTKRNLPKLKSKLVIKSNTVVYVGHSYHLKTKSTKFLINYLSKYFDIKEVLDESWKGKTFVNLNFINQTYRGVIFFQNLPPIDIFNHIDNDNIIFFPMYDMMLGQPKEYWLQYKNLKVINFSKTLHNQLQEWGINSTYIQYFPKPLYFSPGKPNRVYFWQRITDININLIPALFPNENLKVHLHTAIDPQQKFIKPTKQLEKKYNITYSNWFKTRQQAQEIIKKKGIYIAPRFYEGIGLSFLEAMAMGKAIVAVNNPTMNEYITNNITGYLYNPNNPTPISLKNVKQIQKNTYQYISKGYEQWQKSKYKIIKIIKQNKISNNDKS